MNVSGLKSIKIGKVNSLKVYKDPGNNSGFLSYYPLYFTWERQIWADGYEVWRGKGTKGKFSRIINVKGNKDYLTDFTVKDTEARKGNTYRYKVRAYRIVNGKKKCGTFSKTITVKL